MYVRVRGEKVIDILCINNRLLQYFSIAVSCGNLSNPVDGEVRADGNTFGSQANYSCSEGYVLNGNSTRMCQSDGQWSGSEPRCEGQDCCLCVCMYVELGYMLRHVYMYV